jgi:hypothetical protein
MHQERNLQILELLANGINPVNNEVFPPDHPCQHPEVIRALFNAVTVVKKSYFIFQKKMNPVEPAKKGVPWTKEEDRNLIDAFKENPSLEQLAKKHERSRTAIETRLVKLGLAQPKYMAAAAYNHKDESVSV